MKAFWKRKTGYDFRRELNAYFFRVLLISGLLINAILFELYSYREHQVVMDGKRSMINQTIAYTDQIMKEIDTIGETIWTSSQVQKIKMSNTQNIDYMAYLSCMNYLSAMKLSVNSIYRIRVYNTNTSTLITSDNGVFYSVDQNVSDYYNNQMTNTEDKIWTMDFNGNINDFGVATKKVITYVRPIYSVTTGRKFGLLCIDVPIELFHELINHYDDNEKEGFTIIQGDNIVTNEFYQNSIIDVIKDNLSQFSKASMALNGNLKFKYNSKQYICVYDTSKYSGWKFFTYYRYNYFLTNQLPALACGILFILILYFAYKILIRVSKEKIIHPIELLLDAMGKFEQGEFGVQITEKRSDIFDVIFKCFNHMSERSKQLVEDLILERLRMKESKLRMLQSQIRPHFLYNIFNNMIWMSEQKNYTALEQMIYATAGYYKTSLNFGQQLICLADNLKQLKYYAQIQEVRFPNRFTCDIIFDEDILSACIPNLMLQPLLENAINHGAAGKEGITKIKIHGYRKNEELYFEVWDNGVGITPEHLAEIRNAINEEGYNGQDYFALVNIAERLRMYYQDKGQITIDSLYGSWTLVVLKLTEDETLCIN